MALQDGVKTVRNTFERALTAAGLHAAKGVILWEAYREFENVMLAMLQVIGALIRFVCVCVTVNHQDIFRHSVINLLLKGCYDNVILQL
jgi:hypothetical protein